MEDNRRFHVDKIISCTVKDAKTGEILGELNFEQCPLFDFCSYKTAMCRTALPDESCYWYRYFKELIDKNNK